MKSSLSLIYTVCRIFLYRSKIFPNFFTALYFLAMPHLLTKTAEQNSAGKQKKQARIFGARKHEVHIFHPAELSLPATADRHPLGILLYRANLRLPAASTSHPGASRPTPLAALLFIPATQSFASQLPSSRLGRPTPYTSPTSTSNPIISTFFFLFLSPTSFRLFPPFFHFSISNL